MITKFVQWISGVILKLTHNMWNRRIYTILSLMCQKNIINSQQLQELLAKFDPTKDHWIAANIDEILEKAEKVVKVIRSEDALIGNQASSGYYPGFQGYQASSGFQGYQASSGDPK